MTECSEESHILRLTERNSLIKRVSGLGGGIEEEENQVQRHQGQEACG